MRKDKGAASIGAKTNPAAVSLHQEHKKSAPNKENLQAEDRDLFPPKKVEDKGATKLFIKQRCSDAAEQQHGRVQWKAHAGMR